MSILPLLYAVSSGVWRNGSYWNSIQWNRRRMPGSRSVARSIATPAPDDVMHIERDGIGVGQRRRSEPEPLPDRLDEEQISVDEHPEVRQRLEVARKRLMEVFGKSGQRRPQRRIVVFDVIESTRCVSQCQTEDGQIVVARHETRCDGAVAVEPVREVVDKCLRVRAAVGRGRRTPGFGKAAPVRLNCGNRVLHRVFHEEPLRFRQTEELVRQIIGFFEHVAFARLMLKNPTAQSKPSFNRSDQRIRRRLRSLPLGRVVR